MGASIRRILTMVLLGACIVSGPHHPSLGDDAKVDQGTAWRSLQQQIVAVTAQAEAALVSIARVVPSREVPFPADYDPFVPADAESGGFVVDGFGSGVILKVEESSRLLILTNHHVVTGRVGVPDAEADRIYIRTVGGHTLLATLHAYDPRSDLAVLTADLKEVNAEVLKIVPPKLGDGDAIQKGQMLLVLGNSLGLARDGSCSVAWGLASGFQRRPGAREDRSPIESGKTIHELGTLLQLDLRISPGMSGGAVLNLEGELVGLTTSLADLLGDPAASGFAIPTTAGIRRVIETLLRGEEVEYGFLGIDPDRGYPEDLRPARPFVTQGTAARVGRVAHNSPAFRAGLLEGDQVYAVGERTILDPDALIREIGLLGPAAVATLRVFRPRTRKFLTIEVTLGKWPVYDDRQIVATGLRQEPWRGVQVDYATGRFRYLPDSFLSVYPQGVVVTRVEPGSPAALAGLRVGTAITRVAGAEVNSPFEFAQRTRALVDEVEVQLRTDERLMIPPVSALN
ncbi:MAG: trypsin-like peptidase domain-containing protein [Planctomycetaceae bacterium]|nr:trypsin-like peptidase domain-containing protein [Planctomycetaceae bacterium]